ncbi:hypothetical protein HanPSC8_Chr16g0705041 [Helianthus annuus]|nr:hypothetical protein HanPSC8_Chr16g0705041 [Helianthus annuus]
MLIKNITHFTHIKFLAPFCRVQHGAVPVEHAPCSIIVTGNPVLSQTVG